MKLGLGTAQFGLDYGVSNTGGKTVSTEIAAILKRAMENGIRTIDTASVYGSSEAELGSILSLMGQSFEVVTKIPRLASVGNSATIEQTLYTSLNRLHMRSVYGLLFHNADDLLSDNASQLVDTVMNLKRQGIIKKWGFSAYTGQQINAILERFSPDLIQVPVNVLDQRLLHSGHLKLLKQAGIEIHARSVFLQGLLLMETSSLDSYFAPYRGLLDSFHHAALSSSLSPLHAALRFVLEIEEIDRVIVGVCSDRELQQIIDAIKIAPSGGINYEQLASSDEKLVNPALWRLRQ